MTTRPELAYSFVPKMVGGQLRSFVVAICSSCGASDQFRWKAANNPHHVTHRFQRHGWDFNPYHASRNLCRNCNPHYHETTICNPISLPGGFKNYSERITWLRTHLQLEISDIIEASGLSNRTYRALEDNRGIGFHELHTAVGKVVPIFRKFNLPVTLRWVLGLPEQGSCLAINFKVAMECKSMTVGFLASGTGISPKIIEDILSGAIKTYHRLDELARALGTTRDVLMSEVAALPKKIKKVEPKPIAIAVKPALVAPPPAPVSTKIPKEKLILVGDRLHRMRHDAGINQHALASDIYDIDGIGDEISLTTLNVYISKIENAQPVRHNIEILRACASVLNVNPDYLCGISDDPAVPAVPAVVLPAIVEHIPVTDAENLRQEIKAAVADLAATEEIMRADMAQYQSLLADSRNKIAELSAKLEAAIVIPVQQMAIEPVVIDPKVLAPAILTQPVKGHEAVNGVEAVKQPRSSWVNNGWIDREAVTKQNTFAKFLTCDRFGDQTITLDTILSGMKNIIENVIVPGNLRPRESIRRMVLREAMAPNGRLVEIAPGNWKLREQELVAAE